MSIVGHGPIQRTGSYIKDMVLFRTGSMSIVGHGPITRTGYYKKDSVLCLIGQSTIFKIGGGRLQVVS